MAATKGSERVENMTNALRQWQEIERQGISDTAEIIESTNSPLLRIVMEIIRHDSMMHHRVHQFLVDSLTKEDVAVTREDVAQIWDKIEKHNKVERKSVELAKTLREEAWSPVHKQLLDYLLADESKHAALLDHLEKLKQGMGLASGA